MLETNDTLHFVMRYTPFWSVPLGFVGMRFGRIYREKDFVKTARSFYALVLLCGIATIFYFVTGGPERTVERGLQIQSEIQR